MNLKVYSFVENDEEALSSAIRGFVAAYPQARYNRAHKVVYKSDKTRQDRVTILSGGGSGHEPSHVGFVGRGMLDAAVCGAIFASPSALQIEAALKLTQSPQGTLIIVKNYTGDKLNFTLAAERFRFASGVPLKLVVVADDVSINRTRCAKVGRRGLAGTVLVHKVAGAASAAGLQLHDIAGLAEFTANNVYTIAAGLDGCDRPGQHHEQRLGPNEIEIGIGIHNEPGSKRVFPQPSLADLVSELLAGILHADEEHNYLSSTPNAATYSQTIIIPTSKMTAFPTTLQPADINKSH